MTNRLIQNGTIETYGRTWPLYERWAWDDGREVMVLEMKPEHRAELEALDKTVRDSDAL